MPLIEMAIAFVRHPAVTAAIIDPRTMEQFERQLPAAEVTLSEDVIDRIDTSGTNINRGISPPRSRRRHVASHWGGS